MGIITPPQIPIIKLPDFNRRPQLKTLAGNCILPDPKPWPDLEPILKEPIPFPTLNLLGDVNENNAGEKLQTLWEQLNKPITKSFSFRPHKKIGYGKLFKVKFPRKLKKALRHLKISDPQFETKEISSLTYVSSVTVYIDLKDPYPLTKQVRRAINMLKNNINIQ